MPTTSKFRKPRKLRWIIHQPDKSQDFISADTIKYFSHLVEENFCLNSFELKKTEDYILIYRIVFDLETHFPTIKECFCIDRNLHVQIQCDENPVPLPQWFIDGYEVKLTWFSMIEKFPNYIENVVEEQLYSILKELQKKTLKKQRLSFIFCQANKLCLTSALYAKTSLQITSGKFFVIIFIRENLKWWRRINYSCKIALGKR